MPKSNIYKFCTAARDGRTGSVRKGVTCFATVIIAIAPFDRNAIADDVGHAGHALGKVEFPVSCSERAQPLFNRALALLHHMTYPQAREEFQQLANSEPGCAMAHWGIAMTLFQPLWPTRPSPAELACGLREVQQAAALQATPREREFIAAAAAFFSDKESPTFWQRIGRWEQRTQVAYAALPNDPEAAVFYALALLAVAPADKISRANADRAAALLLPVYERNPEHPGAMHYLVHANDVPGRERDLLDIVRKYDSVAPRNPHALHMPTHIYTRLGEWDNVIRGNLLAAEAALEQPAGEQGQYVWDEFPHAIEYLVYAYLQHGADAAATAQVRRLRETPQLEPTFKTAFHLASTGARLALERRRWQEASQLVPRTPSALAWDRFPWPESITWFARGLGAAHLGRREDTGRAIDRLAELEGKAHETGEVLFERSIRVLRLAVEAWRAQAAGDVPASRALMRQAAELEAATPKHAVTPAPTLPAYEMLGDLLLEQHDPLQALAAYERSLQFYPRRFNSLLGAARSARAAAMPERAQAYYREVTILGTHSDRHEQVAEARRHASGLKRE
jgi:tetratricopeptide (TPR) repeat protein